MTCGISARLGLALMLLFATCAALFAQTESATLSGRITDSSGAVVPQSEVQVTNILTNTRTARNTNSSGIYVIPNLSPGRYRVTVKKAGFKEINLTDLVLNVQDIVNQNFALQIGSVTESVTVVAQSSGVDTISPAVGTVIDHQFVQNLPLNGRSFQALIELTPGVVVSAADFGSQGQFSVNGQRTSSNYFTVDGVSANFGGVGGANLLQFGAGVNPALSAQGGTNNLVSVEAMQEFRIQTSTYAPEFGRSPGAQISISTRSGENVFHGSLFEYLRNDKLNANDWFNNNLGLEKPQERQNDFGGSLGGPIFRDRTFFFVTYEGLRLRIPRTVSTEVPTLIARASAAPEVRPFLDAYPLPNGPISSSSPDLAQFNTGFSDPSTLNSYSIRIDHTLSKRLQIFGRYNDANSKSSKRADDSEIALAANNITSTDFTTRMATLGSGWAITNAITNDLRLNYSRHRTVAGLNLDTLGGAVVPADSAFFTFPPPYTSANTLFAWIVLGGKNTSYLYGASAGNLQRQFNLVDTLSFIAGSHSLKIGADYRHLSPLYEPRQNSAQVAFFSMGTAVANLPAVAATQFSRRGTLFFNNIGLFAQDTWRILPRLTMTYGLRWDVDVTPTLGEGLQPLSVTGSFDDLSTLALAPPGTPLWRTPYGNFAPRIGAAYLLADNPRWETVLRGGFGVFYDLSSQQAGRLAQVNYPPFGAASVFLGPILGGTGSFPFTPSQAQSPQISTVPPIENFVTLFSPKLKLPYTLQWNVALEQGLGDKQTFSVSYVGAIGRRLLQAESVFGPVGVADTFDSPVLIDNTATSDYHALQLQFQRRLSAGLQALASYTWGHSIDTASNDSLGDEVRLRDTNSNINHGNSSFDIRHTFTAGVTYDIPAPSGNRVVRSILGGWSVDNIFRTRSASPLTVFTVDAFFLQSNANVRVDVVPGVPLFLEGDQFPGGKALNPAAFATPPLDASGNVVRQGTLGRNVLRGFGANQWDFTVRRQFSLTEKVKLQFRTEFFNLFNHPNFGPPETFFFTDPTTGSITSSFGKAQQMLASSLGQGGGIGFSQLYQIGGPRAIQFALRLSF